MFVAALSMVATVNAQGLSEKEIKKATKAAQAEVKNAKDQLADNGNLRMARNIIDKSMQNEYVKDWAETWSVAASVYFQLYTNENIKSYQNTPYDTVAMYDYLTKWYEYAIICDSLQQIPNAKGKTSTACRDAHGYEMYRSHTNFINGGIFYFNNRKDYAKAYEMFDNYYQIAETDIMKKYLADDENFANYTVEFAYFPTLAANNMQDYQKVLKYVDKAIEDPEYGPACQRIKAEAYENMKDTVNWISNLMTGIVKFPKDEYFYTKIIMYYNDTEKWEELEKFVTDRTDVLSSSVSTNTEGISSLGNVYSVQLIIKLDYLFFILSYVNCLYMLNINIPYQSYRLQIFSPNSVGYHSVLLMVSFAEQKLLSLIGSYLFIFAFISFASGDRYKNILLPYVKEYLPLFSFRNFMVF